MGTMELTFKYKKSTDQCVVDADPHDSIATLRNKVCVGLFGGVSGEHNQLKLMIVNSDGLDAEDSDLVYQCAISSGDTIEVDRAVSEAERTKALQLYYASLEKSGSEKKQLLVESMNLNPEFTTPYNNLSFELEKGETVTLNDGSEMTKKDLLLKCITIDPQDAKAYYNLSSDLKKGETVTLNDGLEMTAKDLLLKCITIDPQDADTYNNLSCELEKGRNSDIE